MRFSIVPFLLSTVVLCVLICCGFIGTVNSQACVSTGSSACPVNYLVPVNSTTALTQEFKDAMIITGIQFLKKFAVPDRCTKAYKTWMCASFYPKCTEEYPGGVPPCRSQCEHIQIACQNTVVQGNLTCDFLPETNCMTYGAASAIQWKSSIAVAMVVALLSILFY